MNQFYPTLQKCALFKDIDTSELKSMLNCLEARTVSYSRNEIIFCEEDPARYVGIVLSGKVQIIKEDFFGNRNIIALMDVSQMFGEAFACAGVQRLPVTATAVCDSEILLIPCRRIITTCSNSCEFHNRIISNLLQILAAKNLLLNQKLELISRRTTREKLMAYLMNQAKQNKSNTFTIPYNRQALADYLGVDRSAMSSELGKMRREGLVDFSRNQFHLTVKENPALQDSPPDKKS